MELSGLFLELVGSVTFFLLSGQRSLAGLCSEDLCHCLGNQGRVPRQTMGTWGWGRAYRMEVSVLCLSKGALLPQWSWDW